MRNAKTYKDEPLLLADSALMFIQVLGRFGEETSQSRRQQGELSIATFRKGREGKGEGRGQCIEFQEMIRT